MKVFFFDCEASSLTRYGHPIEVGWVGPDGKGESHLIRPPSAWSDWSDESEAVHGITRKLLMAEGRPVRWVAARLIAALAQPGARVFSDAPGFDLGWLNELMAAAGHRPGTVRLHDVAEAYAQACLPLEEAGIEGDALAREVLAIVAAAREAENARERTRHRALEDAASLWRVWRDVAAVAAAVAARVDAQPHS